MANHYLPSTFLLLLLGAFAVVSSSGELCNGDDQKALLAISSFWGGPRTLSSWRPTTPCCNWSWVECDATGRVGALTVTTDTHIRSTIPPAVGDLPFLTSLRLDYLPNLAGPIIPAIARLTRLSVLDLHANALTGPIPSFIASLSELQSLDLSRNRLTGSIPPGIGFLPRLTYLSLDDNRITGPVPDSFGNFPPGFLLYSNNNRLTGPLPSSLGGVEFAMLALVGNQLSGDASAVFRRSNVSFSREIRLARNMLEFDLGKVEFPASLVTLELSHNRIYGRIPEQIAELRQLQWLNVSYNRLCGEIPKAENLARFNQWSYVHNLCLCGSPLPPC